MSEAHTDPHPDVAGYLLGNLEPEEMIAFEAHLPTCPACQAEVEELGSLPGLLDQALPAVELPQALRARTLAAVANAPARAADAHVPAPATGTPPVAVEIDRARRRRLVRRLPAPRLAVAALVALALAVAAIVVDLGRSTQPAAAEIELVAAPGESGRGHATVRKQEDGGLLVRLDVEGLRPSAPGTYYECWFVGEGDSLEAPNRVSAGTFRVGPDGSADIEMASAADLGRFPKMGVTREPDDGNPQRTGPKVLVTQR